MGGARARHCRWHRLDASRPPHCQSGELERAIVIADEVLEDAQRRGSPLAFATASHTRSMPRLWQGAVTEALADLELARDARRYGWRRFIRSAAANVPCV